MALQMALAHPHIYIENDALENLEVEDITTECVAGIGGVSSTSTSRFFNAAIPLPHT